MLYVAFEHDEPHASAFILACEAFDLDAAGDRHREDPSFSLNAADAFIYGNQVVVPVEGAYELADIEELALVPVFSFRKGIEQ